MGKDNLNQKLEFYKSGYREKFFADELRGCISLRLKWLQQIKQQLLLHHWEETEKLEACMHHGRPEFYILETESKKYITSEKRDLAKRLAQRDYERALLHSIEYEEKTWTRILKSWKAPEDIYNKTSEARRVLISPIKEETEKLVFEWQNQEYKGKAFDEEDRTEFYTRRGERVRSKSEVLIADTLNEMGIPYLYEFPVRLSNQVVYPDFLILNKRTFEVMIWEHLGMLDNPIYVENNMKKIMKYSTHGWVQGKNLLLTFESARCPISTRLIRMIIEQNLL